MSGTNLRLSEKNVKERNVHLENVCVTTHEAEIRLDAASQAHPPVKRRLHDDDFTLGTLGVKGFVLAELLHI